jgi:hypothetical protein
MKFILNVWKLFIFYIRSIFEVIYVKKIKILKFIYNILCRYMLNMLGQVGLGRLG